MQVAEDPENVLPLPPAFGDPNAAAPLLPGGAPGGPVAPAARRLMADFLANVGSCCGLFVWLLVHISDGVYLSQ